MYAIINIKLKQNKCLKYNLIIQIKLGTKIKQALSVSKQRKT